MLHFDSGPLVVLHTFRTNGRILFSHLEMPRRRKKADIAFCVPEKTAEPSRGRAIQDELDAPGWAGLHRFGVEVGELALMPIGIGERDFAGGVQPGDLRWGERPAHSAEILAKL